MALLVAGSIAPAAAAPTCKMVMGGPAPQLAGADLSGQDVSLAQMRGKWVFVDFWASWCKPCMKALPHVVELNKAMSGRSDFAVVSIALDDRSTLGDLQQVASRYQVEYPVVCDGAGWSSAHVAEWCVDSIPATFLIDPDGKVVERNISPEQVRNRLPQPGGVKPPVVTPRPPVVTPQSPSFQFTAKHRLLHDSPTSGKRDYRDLQISLPRPVGQGGVRYQLVLRVGQPAIDDRTVMVRYDIEFTPASRPGQDFPFDVTIREATGARSQIKGGQSVTTTGTAAEMLPGAQIAYDEADQRLLFVLPVPRKAKLASYTVSLFDRTTNDFGSTLAADIATS